MAKQFSQPMPEAVRPASSVSGDNPLGAMKGSGKAAESKASSALGADITAAYDTARPGDVTGQLSVDPIVPFVEAKPGSSGNTGSTTPKISDVNVIGPTGEGEEKAKPGRQKTVKGATGGHASGWVQNVQNPLLQQKPLSGRK